MIHRVTVFVVVLLALLALTGCATSGNSSEELDSAAPNTQPTTEAANSGGLVGIWAGIGYTDAWVAELPDGSEERIEEGGPFAFIDMELTMHEDGTWEEVVAHRPEYADRVPSDYGIPRLSLNDSGGTYTLTSLDGRDVIEFRDSAGQKPLYYELDGDVLRLTYALSDSPYLPEWELERK